MRSVSEIQGDLAAARAARLKVLTRGTQEGNDGASVTRASLGDLNAAIKDLERELTAASGENTITFTPTIGVGT